MFDRAQEKAKNKWKGWYAIMAAFVVALLLGSALAIYIGVNAIPLHLASPP